MLLGQQAARDRMEAAELGVGADAIGWSETTLTIRSRDVFPASMRHTGVGFRVRGGTLAKKNWRRIALGRPAAVEK